MGLEKYFRFVFLKFIIMLIIDIIIIVIITININITIMNNNNKNKSKNNKIIPFTKCTSSRCPWYLSVLIIKSTFLGFLFFFFMGCIKEDFTRLKVNCHFCFFDFSKEMLNSLKNTSFEKLFLGKAPQIMIIPAVSDERK